VAWASFRIKLENSQAHDWGATKESDMMKNVIICTFHCNYYAGKMKEGEIGGACGTNGLNDKCVHNSGHKNYVPIRMYKTHMIIR
jgi:hypothetical protein